MNQSQLPHLTNLMNSYFNQDYDIHGETDEEILSEYKRCSHPATITATIAELDSLLSMSVVGLKERYEQETGKWNVIVGEDDQQVRSWLVGARNLLAS
jgi:hypothetical protein